MAEGDAEIQHGKQEPPESIANRLRKAEGSVKGVTKSDLAREIARFAEEQDADGIRDLYSAYADWESRGNGFKGEEMRRVTPRSPDVLEQDINKNLDTAAALADALIANNGDEYLAFKAIADGTGLNTVGTIRQYYRETVGYEPAPEMQPILQYQAAPDNPLE